jgi:hypothetical protein
MSSQIALDIRLIFAYNSAMQIGEFNKSVCHAGGCSTLAAVAALFFSLQVPGQNTKTPTTPSPASPQAVCVFIVGRMTAMLPQQPTLCSGKQEQAPGYYSISIFSPKNVLEGDTRRAWASALFQTLEDLVDDKSLNGACSATPICFASISDAYMTQHNWRYKTLLSKDSITLLRGKPNPPAEAEFSEVWYLNWWQSLFTFKESDISWSKENATQLGKRACEDYLNALRKIQSELPSCFVLLATDKSIYLALDFTNWGETLLAGTEYELSTTIGRIFDNTGYNGQVLIRSPWTNTGGPAWRVYRTIPLRAIEFTFEEKESGIRDDFDAEELLRSHFSASGQTAQSTFLDGPRENSALRNAAVLKYATGPTDTIVMDTTDGAEWSVSKESFDRCGLQPGDEIEVSTLLISGGTARTDGPPTLSTQKSGVFCKLAAAFVKGW